ncbi:VOC family protein [Acidovorax sp.]|uniref:VOC family protein n=1 Tax=Acidovorax sp. TaxID=1872122 RepID=UPI00391B8998
MQFGYTILYVEDVPRTIAFYEAAFGFARRFVHEAGDYGELDTGATALAFSSLRLMSELGKNPQRASANAPSFEIAFTTPDVAAAVQRAVDAGARLVQAPEQMPWGQTVAYVADINGALVELCTPVAPPAA